MSFDKNYVMRVTLEHMKKRVDVSINKTFDRVKEFESDSGKSLEVFETLSELHTLRRSLEEIQSFHMTPQKADQ